jgi:C4-dicarboxylate transporter/malic acid transport protein
MSTGGIALVLAVTPNRFSGIDVLGTIVFILDLVLFLIITIGMIMRFTFFPGALAASISHPTESLFFPCFWMSIATIISNSNNYGAAKSGLWLTVVLRVLFWIYTACAFLIGVAQYHMLFTAKRLTTNSMTPSWILPIFPAMLVGTIASVISSSQPPNQALPIIICGLTFQGLGFMVSIFIYAVYINRLMTSGLPIPAMRPGMFIAVGPPAFTALAILGMSASSYNIFPSYTTISGVADPSRMPDVLRIVALVFAVFIWTVAFWFFSISLVATVSGLMTGKMTFHLSWYCFVFPNVGLTISLVDIGQAFDSQGILWIGSAMTIILVAIWLFVGASHATAVWKKQIMWPGKDEDHDE